jgi:hypothetical protein
MTRKGNNERNRRLSSPPIFSAFGTHPPMTAYNPAARLNSRLQPNLLLKTTNPEKILAKTINM